MSANPREHAIAARDHLLEAVRYSLLQGIEQPVLRDAICLRIAAALDALSKLDDATRTHLFGHQWAEMRGLRNRIVHGYFTIDHELISTTMNVEIPLLVERLAAFID